MLPGQLISVKFAPRNIPLKFGQNWVSNSLDMSDMDKLSWVKLWLGWGFDNNGMSIDLAMNISNIIQN